MTTLLKSKRRRRVYCSKEPPLPVPVESITGVPPSGGCWNYYTGELEGNAVLVKRSGDIQFLYRLGYYGKGQFSKREPQAVTECQRSLPGKFNDGLKVMSRRSYLLRRKWYHEAQGEVSDVDEGMSLRQCKHSLELTTENTETNSAHTLANCNKKSGLSCPGSDASDEVSVVVKDSEATSTQHNVLESEQKWQTSAEDWAEDEGNFWGTSADVGESEESRRARTLCSNPVVDPWSNVEASEDFWMSDAGGDTCLSETRGQDRHSSPHVISNLFESEKGSDAELHKEEIHGLSSKDVEDSNNRTRLNVTEVQNVSSGEFSGDGCNENSAIHMDDESSSGQCLDEVADDLESNVGYHPLSLLDESDGELLVVDDSDYSEDEAGDESEMKWRPCQKRDPYPVEEYLQLSFEEAFFLSYGLGCLTVLDECKEPLNLTSMWKRFCKASPRFLPNYIAYHYYRSKGWVPKSGLKYGADFLLYKQGPPFYHSLYSLVVRMVDDRDLRCNKHNRRQFSWISLAGMNRITEHVNKELLFCFVVKPSSLSDQDLLSPRCIQQFRVQEIVMKRWVAKQERDQHGNIVPEMIP